MKGLGILLIIIGLADIAKIARMNAIADVSNVPYMSLEIGLPFIALGLVLLVGGFLERKSKRG